MPCTWLVKRPQSLAWSPAEAQACQAGAWDAVAQDLSYRYLQQVPAWVLAETSSTVVALHTLQALAGCAAHQVASYHYVVETDVLPEAEADFNAWYEQEHLPGLAAVPGTVRALRYRQATGQPKYWACYDLAHEDVLGSPAWLAVRGTPWSDRIRPAFRNTLRTRFRRAP